MLNLFTGLTLLKQSEDNFTVVDTTGPFESIGKLTNIVNGLNLILTVLFFLLGIILFIKAFIEQKKLQKEISIKTINSIKNTSKIMLFITFLTLIIAVCILVVTRFLSNYIVNPFLILEFIFSMYAFLFANHSQKMFLEENFEIAKKELYIVKTLNFIIVGAMIIVPKVMFCTF
ncbi:MAG: hypothetical protein J6M02_06305 [Clostridia bacterium]|nr:hypothetical protein [Clostridia bacterium]